MDAKITIHRERIMGLMCQYLPGGIPNKKAKCNIFGLSFRYFSADERRTGGKWEITLNHRYVPCELYNPITDKFYCCYGPSCSQPGTRLPCAKYHISTNNTELTLQIEVLSMIVSAHVTNFHFNRDDLQKYPLVYADYPNVPHDIIDYYKTSLYSPTLVIFGSIRLPPNGNHDVDYAVVSDVLADWRRITYTNPLMQPLVYDRSLSLGKNIRILQLKYLNNIVYDSTISDIDMSHPLSTILDAVLPLDGFETRHSFTYPQPHPKDIVRYRVSRDSSCGRTSRDRTYPDKSRDRTYSDRSRDRTPRDRTSRDRTSRDRRRDRTSRGRSRDRSHDRSRDRSRDRTSRDRRSRDRSRDRTSRDRSDTVSSLTTGETHMIHELFRVFAERRPEPMPPMYMPGYIPPPPPTPPTLPAPSMFGYQQSMCMPGYQPAFDLNSTTLTDTSERL